MANIALIKYYARLIRKGYDKSQVPVELMPEVEEEISKLPPSEYDPVTETPEKK